MQLPAHSKRRLHFTKLCSWNGFLQICTLQILQSSALEMNTWYRCRDTGYFSVIFCYFSVFFRCPRPPRKFFCRVPCLGTRLFIKVPRPGDSEVGTFSVFVSNCHLFLPSIHS